MHSLHRNIVEGIHVHNHFPLKKVRGEGEGREYERGGGGREHKRGEKSMKDGEKRI